MMVMMSRFKHQTGAAIALVINNVTGRPGCPVSDKCDPPCRSRREGEFPYQYLFVCAAYPSSGQRPLFISLCAYAGGRTSCRRTLGNLCGTDPSYCWNRTQGGVGSHRALTASYWRTLLCTLNYVQGKKNLDEIANLDLACGSSGRPLPHWCKCWPLWFFLSIGLDSSSGLTSGSKEDQLRTSSGKCWAEDCIAPGTFSLALGFGLWEYCHSSSCLAMLPLAVTCNCCCLSLHRVPPRSICLLWGAGDCREIPLSSSEIQFPLCHML